MNNLQMRVLRIIIWSTYLWSFNTCVANASEQIPTYDYATHGVICFKDCSWKLLLDQSNLGGMEMEIMEIILPAGTHTVPHPHGSIEVIYVISGQVGHEVNGELYQLDPGMLGIVRPGDKVRHIVTGQDAKILVIWAPGGEAKRLFDYKKGHLIKNE